MKLVCLAGQDPIKNLEKLRKKIRQRKKAEGETYLWDKYKALVEINGKPLIYYFLSAVDDAKTIESKVVLVGKSELEEKLNEIKKSMKKEYFFVEQGKSFGENMNLGYEKLKQVYSLPKNEHIMFMTSDIPNLTGEIIDKTNEINKEKLTTNFVYPLVDSKTLNNYPRNFFPAYDDTLGEKPKIKKMKESSFFYVNGHADLGGIGKLFDYRKGLDPVTWIKLAEYLVKTLGIFEVGSVALNLSDQFINKGGLKVSYIEHEMSKVTNSNVRFIENYYSEFNEDVDSEEDIERMEERLNKEINNKI